MSDQPKDSYEAPSVEEVHTEDAPTVTAAGQDSPVGDLDTPSDLRLKDSLRSLEGAVLRSR
jgi:hypothetical protein